ncbi:MAG: hydrolase [Flavobacteriaceae bacterium]|nr:hydrolase [Bacteroidia bacterium]NNL16868.1 hydrolase [Flavobacteriaceae bacterium]
MYLFIFTVLLVLFQYVNSKNVLDKYETDIKTTKTENKTLKDSLFILEDKIVDLSYFNLDRNEDALSYFEKSGFDVSELIPFIKDELYTLNEIKGEHPLIPYASSEGRKLIINNVKLLNHKWIIADFSDGEFWGELFLTYEIIENKELKFKLVESFLYPLQ